MPSMPIYNAETSSAIYSKDWNKRTVWNKRTGGKILKKQ